MAGPRLRHRGCVPIGRVDDLVDEYVETKQFVEEEKPYWVFLDAERGQELRYGLFNYFPAAHYKRAIDHALEQAVAEEDEQLVPDGGRYTETLYAWYDPDTDTYLTHAEAGDEFATPFFEEEEAARRFLDHRAREVDDNDRFDGLSLQKLRAKKIGEAVEVLTDQSGIHDFVPDGGTNNDPVLDSVFFWYDPDTNAVVQEEVLPDLWAGLFDYEDEALIFMEQYLEDYPERQVEDFELYEAELEKHGDVKQIL